MVEREGKKRLVVGEGGRGSDLGRRMGVWRFGLGGEN